MSQSDRQQIIFCFILASTALAVAMGIGRFAFTPILPLMIQEGKVHLAQTAWLSSSNYIGYLVGAKLFADLAVFWLGGGFVGGVVAGVTTPL